MTALGFAMLIIFSVLAFTFAYIERKTGDDLSLYGGQAAICAIFGALFMVAGITVWLWRVMP